MTTFFTDLEASGGGEFLDTAEVGIRYTLPAGTINYFRVYWPAVAPSGTPVMHLWDSGGSLLQTVSFDTTALSGWNSATPAVPIAVTAGTYYVSWGTTRYKAILGFFSGGPVIRGSITAVEGRFASVGAFPAGTSAAAYVADLDFTPSGGGSGSAPTGVAVPVGLGQPATVIPATAPAGLAIATALGQPTAALNRSAAPTGLAVAVALGTPTVGRNGASPNGLVVAAALGTPAVALNRAAAPAGLAAPVALGAPSTNAPGRAITTRPFTGITARPNSGITRRP